MYFTSLENDLGEVETSCIFIVDFYNNVIFKLIANNSQWLKIIVSAVYLHGNSLNLS